MKLTTPGDDEHLTLLRAAWEIAKVEEQRAHDELAQILALATETKVNSNVIKAFAGSENRKKSYNEFRIKKRNGGERVILAPDRTLKWIQRAILVLFTKLFPRNKCAMGFERGKSIITNASLHCRKKNIYLVDIKDFFPSISHSRIFGMLLASPFAASTSIARLITNLTTINGSLPQGAPSSPLLANLLCRRLDQRLLKWAKLHHYTYSRYADDLAFSTNKLEFPEEHRKEIEVIIQGEGFQLNPLKSRLLVKTRRQLVTGLVVNNHKPTVTREYKRELRAVLHNIEKHGWTSQVQRKCLFESAEEYRDYINGSLELSKVSASDDLQNSHRLIINPGSVYRRAKDSKSLYQLVLGRVDFLGNVLGRESPQYLHFKQWLDRLALKEDYMTGMVERSKAKAEIERAEQRGHSYQSFQESLKKIKTIEEFRILLDANEYPPELRWLSQQEFGSLKEATDKALQARFASLRSAKDTARFFRYFKTDEYFEGILHSPKETPYELLLQKCELLYARKGTDLPNNLQNKIKKFLDECRRASNKEINKGQHLWNDEEFRNTVIFPFKRETRFQAGTPEGTDLQKLLQEILEKSLTSVSPTKEIGYKFSRWNRRKIYTDVNSIGKGLASIIHSMVSYASSKILDISLYLPKIKEDGLEHYYLEISDPEGTLQEEYSEVSALFGGDLKESLRRFRGLVDWEIHARDMQGSAYIFDVTNNSVKNLASTDALPGFTHRLLFYLV